MTNKYIVEKLMLPNIMQKESSKKYNMCHLYLRSHVSISNKRNQF